MGPKVFFNCAGFIKIDTAAMDDTTDSYVEVIYCIIPYYIIVGVIASLVVVSHYRICYCIVECGIVSSDGVLYNRRWYCIIGGDIA